MQEQDTLEIFEPIKSKKWIYVSISIIILVIIIILILTKPLKEEILEEDIPQEVSEGEIPEENITQEEIIIEGPFEEEVKTGSGGEGFDE